MADPQEANRPTADYGLFVGGQLLGIIEAKKVTVNPQNVLEQAKRYAAAKPRTEKGVMIPCLRNRS